MKQVLVQSAIHSRVLWIACLSLLLYPLTTAAQSSSIPPDEVEVSTPRYKPRFDEFEPPLGEYTYKVSWQGIPAAEVEVTVEEDGLKYNIAAKAKTFSAIDLFYKLRYSAEGVVSAVTLQPEKVKINHRENSRYKQTEMVFRPDGSIYSVYSNRGKDDEVFDFNPKNATLDPFSAAFIARSLPWSEGETKLFDTFNGKSRYLISLTAESRERIWIEGRVRDVWVIVPQVQKLTDPKAPSKLREAKIYVTDDKDRDVLQIVSSVFIGSVKTRLVSFKPSQKKAPDGQLAQLRAQSLK